MNIWYVYVYIWSPSTTTLSIPCWFSSKKKRFAPFFLQVAITLLRLLLITSFEGGWWLLTLDLDQSVWIIRALRGGWCHHTRVVDLSCRCRKKCCKQINWDSRWVFGILFLEGQVWTNESWTMTGLKDVVFPCWLFEWESQHDSRICETHAGSRWCN